MQIYLVDAKVRPGKRKKTFSTYRASVFFFKAQMGVHTRTLLSKNYYIQART